MENLYAKDRNENFDQLFASPKALYRDTPFWAWNCKLEAEELKKQIYIFKEMGMGGFHMHSRTGLATEYLGADFMNRVSECVENAKKLDMLAYLYDEDRWPSGAAGGSVTRNPKFRARYLLFTPNRRTQKIDANNDNSGRFLAAYSVKLDPAGALERYRLIGEDDSPDADAEKFYAYLMVANPESWFNNQTYVDTLNPAAIQKFIDLTYEAYFRKFGKEFGHTIPSIFTDEPQFTRKQSLTFATEKCDARFPFTDDLPESYRTAYNCDLFATFPEVIWELPDGKFSLARYRYHDHVSERFTVAFADKIGEWCEKHNIVFSGHMMEERSLESQTAALGEAMRSYRSFQLPGIDMLCDSFEYVTAKQAQSASHQYGRGGVLSELDGVTDWDWDFKGHKGHGDWQAALGVTVRVPHLAWVSMAGEAKRDYPASINYQSAWYKKYSIIAEHFARVNTAMTRGKARVRVGVIHPIESFWLVFGPQDMTADRRNFLTETFEALIEWLLHGLVDFDLIAESLLPELSPVQSEKSFKVGEMAYDVVIVPPSITLRGTTLERLESFRQAGGRVIFTGDVPVCCDAVESDRVKKLAAQSEQITFNRNSVLHAIEKLRDVAVVKQDGYPLSNLLYQMREDKDARYLFIANTERIGRANPVMIKVRGLWQVIYLDTANGKQTPVLGRHENNWTIFEFPMYPHGSLLVKLLPSTQCQGSMIGVPLLNDKDIETATMLHLSGVIPISLDEPNVLLLDRPQWRLSGDGEWQKAEEILRLDNLCRASLGLPRRSGGIVQPYVHGKSTKVLGTLELLYTIETQIDVESPQFALEEPENAEIYLDGVRVPFNDNGYWVDRSLRTTPLPRLSVGQHELLVRIAYTESCNVERCFILGDFGVELLGDSARIIEPVRKLVWGDVTRQGLPFYGGNITYHCSFTQNEEQELLLRIPSRISGVEPGLCNTETAKEVPLCGYRGVLLDATLDGKEAGDLPFAPYQCELGKVAKGEHKLDLTLYGSRMNCHGAVHLAFRCHWAGPVAWRSNGDMFSYEYQLQPFGITHAPRLLKK
ncbi:MAG: hypothetical protein LBM70_06340 [Victivallales bacterium]|jgi:hypothetical protein|nr:hypothetical protein [Victivallales bacterium]